MTRVALAGCLMVFLTACNGPEENGPDAGSESTHIDAARATCMEFAPGNDAYCDCAVGIVETHVPSEHAHVDEAGTFRVHSDAPEGVHNAVAAADSACKEQHLSDAEDEHEHHDEAVLDAVQTECMAGQGDKAYCTCVRAHFNWHVPVDQVVIGDDGMPSGLKDHSADFMAALADADRSCKDLHLQAAVLGEDPGTDK